MQEERSFGESNTGSGLGQTGGSGSDVSGGLGATSGSTGGLGNSTLGSAGTAASSTSETTGNRLGGLSDLKDTLGNLESRADEFIEQAASQLENAAERLGTIADKVPQKGVGTRAGALGHSTADTLESVARFLRNNDTATLQRELGGLVSNRPLSMLLLAVGAGFVAGKVLR